MLLDILVGSLKDDVVIVILRRLAIVLQSITCIGLDGDQLREHSNNSRFQDDQ